MVRSPMQVDDEFRKRILKIQSELMKQEGKHTSIPKITSKMLSTEEWINLESKLLNKNIKLDFKISFDGKALR